MAALKRETRIYKPVMGNPKNVLDAHRDVRLAAEATERIRMEKLRLLKEARETREAIAITSHVRQVYEYVAQSRRRPALAVPAGLPPDLLRYLSLKYVPSLPFAKSGAALPER